MRNRRQTRRGLARLLQFNESVGRWNDRNGAIFHSEQSGHSVSILDRGRILFIPLREVLGDVLPFPKRLTAWCRRECLARWQDPSLEQPCSGHRGFQ